MSESALAEHKHDAPAKPAKPKKGSREELETLDDYELVKRFTKGTVDAFEVLVLRHKRQVYNFIYKMVGKPEPADDLFQETFLRVLKNAHTYRPRAKFTTWTLQIARNVTLDYFKRENLRQHVSLDATVPGDDKPLRNLVPGNEPPSQDVLLSKELLEEVQSAIKRLPLHQQEALVLRVNEELPYAEISEIVGSPEGTVKYWVHEAVAALTRYLAKRGLT
ncbi:MAG: RNA polymerase sigma24 factor [Planctomycetota bacterium]|nr:RNA polymerase subunit sigma [Planctomycetota bacterium]GIK51073.1 MAG: RNA polymerase sigma24 factor [Planctomycetota bacterium]